MKHLLIISLLMSLSLHAYNQAIMPYDTLKNKADQCFNNKDYACAIKNYEEYLKYNKNDSYCKKQLINAEKKQKTQNDESKEIKEFFRKAQINFVQQDYKAYYDAIMKNEGLLKDSINLALSKEEYANFQLYMGYILLNGKGVPIDTKKAIEWYTLSAFGGNAEALQQMGVFHETGQIVPLIPINLIEAYQFYERSISSGGGDTLEKAKERVKENILKKANTDYESEKYTDAFKLANHFKKEIETCNLPPSVSCLKLQLALADMYYKGLGTNKNANEAKKWWNLAFEQGSVVASSKIAFFYYDEKDYKQAIDWFIKAASKGDVVAKFILGKMYKDGIGVESDDCKAYEWLKQSSDAGNADAKKLLIKIKNIQKIYYDQNWKIVQSLLSTYYRIINLCPNQSPYQVTDYYSMTNVKQKKGQYLKVPNNKVDSLNNPHRQGKFELYDINGNKIKDVEYRNGKEHGTLTQYFEDGSIEYISTFNDGVQTNIERKNSFTLSNKSSRNFVFELNDEGENWHSYILEAGYDNTYWAIGRPYCRYRFKTPQKTYKEDTFNKGIIYEIKWNDLQNNFKISPK